MANYGEGPNANGPVTAAPYHNQTIICHRFPPRVHSYGIWEDANDPIRYSLPALELQMIVIFAMTHLLHFLLKRFRFPKLLSEIIVGILLGPTMPKSIRKYTYYLFPLKTQLTVKTLASFGYTMLLFLIGVKTDASMVMRTGKKAICITIFSIASPLIIGITITSSLAKSLPDAKGMSLAFVAIVQSLSPFPGIALLLRDLKIINSELGRLALSSAMFAELLNVVSVAGLNNYNVYLKKESVGTVLLDSGLLVSFVLFVVFVVRPAMVWVVKQTPEGRPVKEIYIYLITLLVLASCVFTHWVDQFVLLGALLIGIVIPDGPPLGSALVDSLESFVSGLLVPLFVTVNASRADLKTIFYDSSTWAYVALLPIVMLAKIAGSALPAWLCKMPLNDGITLGLIMSTKSVVDMSAYSFAKDAETIDEQTMAVMITSIAFTGVAVPILIRKFYDPMRKYAGYQSRNIMHLKHYSQLRIVACILRPDNISGMINVLDASGPTQDTPISLFVLHLIELRGRSSPLFISHQLQKKTFAGASYSENVIVAFNQYVRNSNGSVTTQTFTAISPRNLMHEDICNVSLDKLVALIIIPFHRKWDVHGSIELEDNGLRAVNRKILERAPCSVGILVDRGHIGRLASSSIAMIFIGGNDDREGLSYAKRVARNPRICLTVVQFTSAAAEEEEGGSHKEKILDECILKDVKENNIEGSEFVFYTEHKVREGAETAMLVRLMIDEYDLIIVGRGNNTAKCTQMSGLEEWSEFPELGTIGDLLASLTGRASILVIQQQQYIRD